MNLFKIIKELYDGEYLVDWKKVYLYSYCGDIYLLQNFRTWNSPWNDKWRKLGYTKSRIIIWEEDIFFTEIKNIDFSKEKLFTYTKQYKINWQKISWYLKSGNSVYLFSKDYYYKITKQLWQQ